MAVLRRKLVYLACLTVSIIIWGHPSYCETTISEQNLASDIVINDSYQPGSGLPMGKIQAVRGEAFVFHRDPDVAYRVQTGLPLYAGDILRTHAAAWIFCRLMDGSHIVLTPLTTLTILQSNNNSARKTTATVLYFRQGRARFQLDPRPDLTAYDFKVQTEAALTLTSEADFAVSVNPSETAVVAFENSRLEVRLLAQPDEITYLSDFQRAVFAADSISPTVETLSQPDIEKVMAGLRYVPQSNLFAIGTENDRGFNEVDEPPVEEDIAQPKVSE